MTNIKLSAAKILGAELVVSCPDLGLEHYAWHLDEDRKLAATLTLMTNPPSCDDDNKLNFHLLAMQTIYTGSQMAKQCSHQVYRISSVIVVD